VRFCRGCISVRIDSCYAVKVKSLLWWCGNAKPGARERARGGRQGSDISRSARHGPCNRFPIESTASQGPQGLSPETFTDPKRPKTDAMSCGFFVSFKQHTDKYIHTYTRTHAQQLPVELSDSNTKPRDGMRRAVVVNELPTTRLLRLLLNPKPETCCE
jgi:hypothetical protein